MASLEAKGIHLFCTPPAVCLPGTIITGYVVLDAQEAALTQLRVKWRGRVYTEIRQQTGDSSRRLKANIELFKEEQILWTRSHAGPTKDLRFTFVMPDQPLPSYLTKRLPTSHTGCVLYYIEVVGDRPGLFRFNRRLRVPVTFSPRERMDDALLLRIPMWSGDWQVLRCQESIRRQLWHEKADIQLSLHIPQLDSCPAHVSVPFRLLVESVSRLQKRSEAGATEFPCPPKGANISFQVVATTTITAGSLSRHESVEVDALFGTLDKDLDEDRAEVGWEPEHKSDGSKGRYRHRVEYSGHLRIDAPPSFGVDILRLQHELRVRLKFGGLAKVQLVAPLKVTSGLTDANLDDARRTAAADGPPQYDEVFSALDRGGDAGGEKKEGQGQGFLRNLA